jgi:hypothetical protein
MKEIDAYNLKKQSKQKMAVQKVVHSKGRALAKGKFADGTKGARFLSEAEERRLK